MLKLAWEISPKRVLLDFFYSSLDNLSLVFVTVIFLRVVVDALEAGREFTYVAIFLLVATVILALCSFFSRWYEDRFLPMSNCYLYEKLTSMLFTQAANVELACFEDTDFYNSYTLAAAEAHGRIESVLKHLSGIVSAAISLVIVFWAMFQVDRFVIIFAIFPLFATLVVTKRMNKNAYAMQSEKAIHNRRLGYADRVMYLRDYANDMRMTDIFSVITHYYTESTRQIVKIIGNYCKEMSFLNTLRAQLTFTFLYEGVVLYSAYMTLVRGTMTIGEFAILSTAMRTGVWTLLGLMYHISDTVKNGLFIKNFRTFLDYIPAQPENQDGETPPAQFETLELCNIGFKYKSGSKHALRNVSLSIGKNETIAIVGHNGAGKSTLTKLLTRLYCPTEGQILLNGSPVNAYNLKAYRNLFTMACQDFRIFSMSVAENVRMSQTFDNDLVKTVLEKSGAYEKVQSLSKGLETTLSREFDDEGVLLSGGENQKIAIARAFARDCQIAIFDEPSSALDPISEYQLFKTMKAHCENKALIFISHRLSSAQYADKVYLFEDGEIIEEGHHEALMARKGKYFDMFTKQAEQYKKGATQNA